MLSPFGASEFPFPKSCHAYLSGIQSVPSGAWTVVGLNAVSWDTYSMYNGGADQYITIAEEGLYLIVSKVQTTALITSPLGGAVYRNGVFDMGYLVAQNSYGVTHVMVAYINMLNADDKLDLRVLWTGTGSIDIGNSWNNCFLQVLKMPYITKGY